jgi:uncharacterized BrkB/YihY/UPF0761 family membrane protein
VKVRPFISKVLKDNVTMLASVVAWGVLSSIIPILVGLIAISGLVLRDPGKQRIIIASLSRALQHVLTSADLRALVHVVVGHTGLLGILGAIGILWGACFLLVSLMTRSQAERRREIRTRWHVFEYLGLSWLIPRPVSPSAWDRHRCQGHDLHRRQ